MQKAPAPLRQDDLPPEDILRRIRVPFIRRASLALNGLSEEVFIVDLALSGVFVERSNPLAIGAPVELTFCLPENELPITAGCRVAWSREKQTPFVPKSLPAGVGLEFVALALPDQQRIHDYLAAYYRQHPRSRRFVSHE